MKNEHWENDVNAVTFKQIKKNITQSDTTLAMSKWSALVYFDWELYEEKHIKKLGSGQLRNIF